MTPRQRTLLQAVADATAQLGRPPYISELVERTATRHQGTRDTAHRLVRLGMLTVVSAPVAQHPLVVRLTPAAKVELGLPVVVLGAWPASSSCSDGDRFAAGIAAIGLVMVSPFLTATAAYDWPAFVAAGAQIAPSCDGVVVFRDRTLVGRADVHAARVARLRCAVIDGWDMMVKATAQTIWSPPFLVPDLPPCTPGAR
jgi:hypothetical protein